MVRKIEILKRLYKEKAERCVPSFYVFFLEFWNINNEEELLINWHLKYLCDKLQDAVENLAAGNNKLYDIIINIPPGTSKSSIISEALNAWTWLIMPNCYFITSSYSATLSNDQSVRSRKIVESEKYKLMFASHFKTKFKRSLFLIKNSEKVWENNFNGGRRATSTGGTITGKHAHIIIKDDPNNADTIESKAHRESAARFNSKTLSTRKKDKLKSFTITVMQRLHDGDATGEDLKKGKNILHICLPAEESNTIKPPELRKYYKNGLLDPIRLNRKALEEARQDLGEFDFSAQFTQDPAPPGGGKIKKDWIQKINAVDLPPDIVWDLLMDSAYTKKKRNDPTGFLLVGYSKRTKILYIKNSKEVRMEAPQLLKYTKGYTEIFNFTYRSRIRIEPKASGMTLKQILNEDKSLNVVYIRSKKLLKVDKDARLSYAAPKIESGKMIFVEGEGTEPVINQITRFPRVEHDEFCDLIGYAAYIYLRK